MNANLGMPSLAIEASIPPSMGVNAADVDRSLTQIQELSKTLLAERDLLFQRLKDLEQENQKLRSSFAALKEKWDNYQPIIQKWGYDSMPPEEAEKIMKENKWISMDEFMSEFRKLVD